MKYYQDLSKFKLPDDFRGRSKYIVQLWWIIHAIFFKNSPQFMYKYRVCLLKLFGARIGDNVLIRSSVKVTYPWKLTIGQNVWIGDESVIYNLADITIGSNVAIAHRVYLSTGSHDIEHEAFNIEAYPINIEDEVWLPNDVFIGPGVTIGRGAVIGARSSVFKDMPSGMVCIGTPCRPVRPRVMKD